MDKSERGIWLDKKESGKDNDAPQQATRVRTPKTEDREVLAIVESLMGASRVKLRCMDGVARMGRIPGSMKKDNWIREGDVVIVIPWDFQDTKADVTWKYTRPQVKWLESEGFLKG